VKSTLSQKDEHLPDAAVQLFVLEACGVPVTAVEIMHLNKDFKHPDQRPLLVRADVTAAVRALQGEISSIVAA
jgi:hypothetical protein